MMIRCIMGAENLPAFVEGMTNLVAGMTVSEMREFAPETQTTVSYRGVPYEVGALSVSVDIVSDESWIEDIVRAINPAPGLATATRRSPASWPRGSLARPSRSTYPAP